MALTDKLNDIGDAIRERRGTTALIPLSKMPDEIRSIKSGSYDEGYSEGYDAGHQVGYDEGNKDGNVEGYNNGYSIGYSNGVSSVPNPLEEALTLGNIYSRAAFNVGSELVIEAPEATSISGAFQNSTGLAKVTLKGVSKRGNSLNSCSSAFRGSELEEVNLQGKYVLPKNASYMFMDALKLKRVNCGAGFTLSSATNITGMFSGCVSLEYVQFKENTIAKAISFEDSPRLSESCVRLIAYGLASVSSAQTVTINSAVNVPDNIKNLISSKGWTLVQSEGQVVSEV